MFIERIGDARGGKIIMNILIYLGKNSIILLATHNALGICRASWSAHIGALWSQLIEGVVLLVLLFLLSGPLNSLVRMPISRRNGDKPN